MPAYFLEKQLLKFDSYTRENDQGEKMSIKDNNTLTMKYPASNRIEKWLDVLPTGNGKIGIGVYGGITDENNYN